MATAVINGRRVEIPSATTDAEIRQAGGINNGRTLIRRTREGNIVIPRNSKVKVQDGATFVDAPRRIKG
jgi:hypothetical protein